MDLEKLKKRPDCFYYTDNGVLLCGDCLKIMPELEPVDLVVTSPPYNCRKDYGSYDDEIPWPEYYLFMDSCLSKFYKNLRDGGVVAINIPTVIRYQHDHKHRETWNDFDPSYIGHRNGARVLGRGRIEPISKKISSLMFSKDPHTREPIIWVKGKSEGGEISTSYMMGSDNNPYMRPCHEVILLGSKKHWHHRGGTGRRGDIAVPYIDYTKDVWYIPPKSSRKHPAIWPEEIPKRLIILFTHAEDSIICDPFSGEGTTLFACEKLNRRWIGIEISEDYCRIAKERIERELHQKKLPGF